MIAVELTWSEVLLASMVGVRRQVAAMERDLPDGRCASDPWNIHIEGAAGEMAFAKATNRYWAAPVNTFHDGGDVGDVQVRTRSKHHYELIVRNDDRDSDWFVLVTGTAPKFVVHGWIQGRAAKRPEWERQHGGFAPAFFVPQEALTSFADRVVAA